jgi:hypothetical protein
MVNDELHKILKEVMWYNVGSIPFCWKNWWKLWETSVGIAIVLAKIQNIHHLMNVECFCYTSLLGITGHSTWENFVFIMSGFSVWEEAKPTW